MVLVETTLSSSDLSSLHGNGSFKCHPTAGCLSLDLSQFTIGYATHPYKGLTVESARAIGRIHLEQNHAYICSLSLENS